MTDKTAWPHKSVGAPVGVRVGYIMTHYPRVALTFVHGEIDEVERHGIAIQPFAMNLPNPADLAAPDAQAEQARTIYLKAGWLRPAAIFVRQFARHPMRMLGVIKSALASAGGSPGLTLRRCAHLMQAALVAHECSRQGITHLHAHFGLAPATIAWLASAIAQAQGRTLSFGFTIHGYHDFADARESRLDLKADSAAYVLCISDFTRAQLCLVTDRALWDKFQVARCGVDLGTLFFREPPARSGPARVMALGRLSQEKGFAVLLEAVSALRQDGVNLTLTFVGDGPLRKELERLAQAAGLAELVHFAGELTPEAVRKELLASDIFCLPSFSEGLPVSIMEAMATGVPVVTTWIAGIPELAVDGETALTVPPARADALAIALRRLIEDPTLGARLAANARKRVEQQHDRTHCGHRVAELLRECSR
jgi:glycosyltransferase involved in cell wall biosynthesis